MRSIAQLKEAADAQVPAADYIPAGTHVAPNVIKLKRTGDYIAIWRLEGISFETADREEIKIRKQGLNNFLRAMGGGNYALWSHKVRRVVHERLNGEYENDFCHDLNNRYYETFDTYRQMATELYITVLYRPTPSRAARMFKRLATRSIEEIKAKEAEDLDVLDDMAKQLEASMSRYEPERLGTFTKQGVAYSEMLAFLGFLVNGIWEDVPMRRADIGEYLPTSRLHFGDKNGMLEIWHPNEHKFVGFLDFQDYPKFSEPGMNNAILYGNYEYIETQSFSIFNKRDAMTALERQKGQLIASEDVADREIQEMDQAMEDLQSGLIEMGEYHYSLAIFGDSLGNVAKSMSEARSVLQDGPGFKMTVIDAIPECAWFAQLPGNWNMRPREASITSRNFACLSPFHNFARGKRHGNPWGEALALMKTPSGQPYYLNFHASPEDKDSTDEKYPGNTFICGTTGVGKTALEMSLLAFATKYAGLRCVFFDKDRGAEIGIRAMGGKYYALKRGQPTGFNPFQLEPTEVNIQFAEKLVKQLVKPQGDNAPSLTAREENDISHAVRTVMSDQVSFDIRCLSAVSQNLRNTGDNSLRERLKKWMRGQPLGWAFDNPRDTQDFSTGRIFGYDYTEFLDDPEVRTPIMAYLLHITESLINGEPFIYFMEEFWKPLMDDMFSDFALNKQKTIRKQSGLGVFVTQSPSDVLVHRIGKTMVEQSVTQMYLPNPKADHDDYVKGFKLTEAEYSIIKNLGESSRMFLVKQGHRSAVVKFDLGGMNDILNVISGTTDNVELLDDIRSEVGDDPQVWMPIFHQRIASRRAQIKK
ncbi:MAG: VirB4 family type IV secretion/conjugal transfer ATPase [Azoarcus sp.]|nr:MAG: VirB4 family type IV secretion/conjugal transfer ATPase [Azoarcus sp.]TVT60052.1 MAG: VirB4 family type IV secretion/conjugal transfer ATPase [Azoarcus sp. PHD]